jgi:hypothetical protein
MRDARASHGIDPGLPRGGNAAGQLNPVKSEFSAGGIDLAAAYSKADREFPQWPLVVTATMFQFPSNPPAIAGEAEEMIAKAVERAKARIQMPIMESSCECCRPTLHEMRQ